MGAVHGQAYGDSTEGPEQGAHDHQKLAATAKRSRHRLSNVEHTSYLAGPHAPKPGHLTPSQPPTSSP
jgi:hypothetical protein